MHCISKQVNTVRNSTRTAFSMLNMGNISTLKVQFLLTNQSHIWRRHWLREESWNHAFPVFWTGLEHSGGFMVKYNRDTVSPRRAGKIFFFKAVRYIFHVILIIGKEIVIRLGY